MRRKLFNVSFPRILTDNVPYCLFGQPGTPSFAVPVHATKRFATGEARCLRPVIEYTLHPARHRNCPGVASLAPKIDDSPMLLAVLKMPKLQVNGFMSAEPTSEEHGEQCAVALALQIVDGGATPESLGLFGRKPVAEFDPELLYALDASYAGGRMARYPGAFQTLVNAGRLQRVDSHANRTSISAHGSDSQRWPLTVD